MLFLSLLSQHLSISPFFVSYLQSLLSHRAGEMHAVRGVCVSVWGARTSSRGGSSHSMCVFCLFQCRRWSGAHIWLLQSSSLTPGWSMSSECWQAMQWAQESPANPRRKPGRKKQVSASVTLVCMWLFQLASCGVMHYLPLLTLKEGPDPEYHRELEAVHSKKLKSTLATTQQCPAMLKHPGGSVCMGKHHSHFFKNVKM